MTTAFAVTGDLLETQDDLWCVTDSLDGIKHIMSFRLGGSLHVPKGTLALCLGFPFVTEDFRGVGMDAIGLKRSIVYLLFDASAAIYLSLGEKRKFNSLFKVISRFADAYPESAV